MYPRYYSADPRLFVILRSEATKNPVNFARNLTGFFASLRMTIPCKTKRPFSTGLNCNVPPDYWKIFLKKVLAFFCKTRYNRFCCCRTAKFIAGGRDPQRFGRFGEVPKLAEGTPLERVQVVNSGAGVQIPPSPLKMRRNREVSSHFLFSTRSQAHRKNKNLFHFSVDKYGNILYNTISAT